jgi:hypothetical protein
VSAPGVMAAQSLADEATKPDGVAFLAALYFFRVQWIGILLLAVFPSIAVLTSAAELLGGLLILEAPTDMFSVTFTVLLVAWIIMITVVLTYHYGPAQFELKRPLPELPGWLRRWRLALFPPLQLHVRDDVDNAECVAVDVDEPGRDDKPLHVDRRRPFVPPPIAHLRDAPSRNPDPSAPEFRGSLLSNPAPLDRGRRRVQYLGQRSVPRPSRPDDPKGDQACEP